MTSIAQLSAAALTEGDGILRLAPTWGPRSFLQPGRRLKLHPGDYYCLDRWNDGDNGILDLSKAYRLKPGTGWLIPPCVLHALGSLVTYEPQWGSDVFGMYQSMVEGRAVPRSLLTKDFPEEQHDNNEYLVDALDWNANVNPSFKDSHYLEPIPVNVPQRKAGSIGGLCTEKWMARSFSPRRNSPLNRARSVRSRMAARTDGSRFKARGRLAT